MEIKEGSNLISRIKEYFGVKDLLKAFIFPLAIALICSLTFIYFFEITIVSGVSMESTLHNEDKLLVSKQAYNNEAPKYKDIVIVKHKTAKCDYIVKRVIGVSGQKVEIRNNEFLIDGVKIEEDYIKETPIYDNNLIISIPEGQVFVMGDNRNNSSDSRDIGLVKTEDIVGKVVFSIWPFTDLD